MSLEKKKEKRVFTYVEQTEMFDTSKNGGMKPYEGSPFVTKVKITKTQIKSLHKDCRDYFKTRGAR